MKNMSSFTRILMAGSVAAAISLLTGLTSTASAQEKGVSKLVQLKPITTVAEADAVAPGDTVVMSCPKCKDSWVTMVEKPTKTGAEAKSATTARHECPGCEHQYVSAGHGKAKTEKLVHVCKQCGSKDAFCCVMKKDAKPTAGMEKQ